MSFGSRHKFPRVKLKWYTLAYWVNESFDSYVRITLLYPWCVEQRFCDHDSLPDGSPIWRVYWGWLPLLVIALLIVAGLYG